MFSAGKHTSTTKKRLHHFDSTITFEQASRAERTSRLANRGDEFQKAGKFPPWMCASTPAPAILDSAIITAHFQKDHPEVTGRWTTLGRTRASSSAKRASCPMKQARFRMCRELGLALPLDLRPISKSRMWYFSINGELLIVSTTSRTPPPLELKGPTRRTTTSELPFFMPAAMCRACPWGKNSQKRATPARGLPRASFTKHYSHLSFNSLLRRSASLAARIAYALLACTYSLPERPILLADSVFVRRECRPCAMLAASNRTTTPPPLA